LRGHRQPHELLPVGADGNAEYMFRAAAGVGDRRPASRAQFDARLRSIGHAADPCRFDKVISEVAAVHLHLRELGYGGRLRILIRPQKCKDHNIGQARVIWVRIIRRTAVADAAIPCHLPGLESCRRDEAVNGAVANAGAVGRIGGIGVGCIRKQIADPDAEDAGQNGWSYQACPVSELRVAADAGRRIHHANGGNRLPPTVRYATAQRGARCGQICSSGIPYGRSRRRQYSDIDQGV
jgi:hypothetical protein